MYAQAVLLAAEQALCSRDRGLWVVNAEGLCRADFFGKSDPYAKVRQYMYNMLGVIHDRYGNICTICPVLFMIPTDNGFLYSTGFSCYMPEL